jgi:hypothetical protein
VAEWGTVVRLCRPARNSSGMVERQRAIFGFECCSISVASGELFGAAPYRYGEHRCTGLG